MTDEELAAEIDEVLDSFPTIIREFSQDKLLHTYTTTTAQELTDVVKMALFCGHTVTVSQNLPAE